MDSTKLKFGFMNVDIIINEMDGVCNLEILNHSAIFIKKHVKGFSITADSSKITSGKELHILGDGIIIGTIPVTYLGKGAMEVILKLNEYFGIEK